MKIFKRKNQKEIKSDTCGLLVEALNSNDFNTSITLANDIKPTTAHYHKLSTEIYWVLEGEIKILIDNVEINVDGGDLIIINPNEVHKVLSASKENKIGVISNPRWTKEDEYIV